MPITFKNTNNQGGIQFLNKFGTGNIFLKSTAVTSDIVRSGLILYIDIADTNSYSGSGTAVYDLSGQGNNGYLTGSYSYNPTNSGYIQFSNTASHIYFSTLPNALSGKKEATLSVWTKISSSTSNYFNFGFNDLTNGITNRFNILVYSNVVYITEEALDIHYVGINSVSPYFNNTWANLTFTYTGSGFSYLYFNGVPIYSSSGYFGNQLSTTLKPFYAGHLNNSNKVDGIGQGLVYDRQLTSNEVLQNYNFAKNRYGL